VINEAIEKKCNLIVAHHPDYFQRVEEDQREKYIEQVIIQAIKHDIAIYAAHTNLDNVLLGVNGKIAEILG
jgi:putative NIF3 family GTP cyclohydrolase 1 type 2